MTTLYALRNRPPGYGAVPRIPFTLEVPPWGTERWARHGAIRFERELTDKEAYDYELTPIVTLEEYIQAVVAKFHDSGYVPEYLEMFDEDRPFAASVVGQKCDDLNLAAPLPSREELTGMVAIALRNSVKEKA